MPPPPPAPAAVPSTPTAPRAWRWVFWAAVLVGAALFVLGIANLFDLRLATGDVYAPYSTYRSDPLGAKALYESLGGLPELRVERNLRPLKYLGEEPSAVLRHRDDDPDPARTSGPVAVLFLGESAFAWPHLFDEAEVQRLETLMNRGGRVVIAFLPTPVEMTVSRLDREREIGRKVAGDKNGPAQPPPAQKKTDGTPASRAPATPTPTPTAEQKKYQREDLIDRWHVDYVRTDNKRNERARKPAPTASPAPLENLACPALGSPPGYQPVAWHSRVSFDLEGHGAKEAGWRAIYTRSSQAVIAERPFGPAGGALMLISDPYFFSNESLNKEAHPTLLAAVVNSCRRLIFDETHLGVTEAPGMMTLARRYDLGDAVIALAVLAVLFLWKNMVSLVPPAAPASGGRQVTGRDSAEGVVNLLRRGVPPRDLLKTCVAQWRASSTIPGKTAPNVELLAQLDDIVAGGAGRRTLVAAYRTICAALKRRGFGVRG